MQVAELAVQFFITNDRPNVAGLVLAGSADFKTELSQSDMFDPRLQAVVLGVVDVSYGGDNGFNQAIELSADMLSNVKFVQVRRASGASGAAGSARGPVGSGAHRRGGLGWVRGAQVCTMAGKQRLLLVAAVEERGTQVRA